jgi:flavin reductase (DIM6/NTAB) family NADH-FMN oxidoreductase RutF
LHQEGQLNLAPYSFFNCFNYRPPIIGFSSNGWKDSVRNITETGEFVWNLATRDLAEAMNETSATLPHGEDEFTFAGLTPVASQLVNAPRVAESPVNFECRLSQCIQLTGADGTPVDTWLVLGKWSVFILPKRCWKRAFTRLRKRNRFCVRVGRRPIP